MVVKRLIFLGTKMKLKIGPRMVAGFLIMSALLIAVGILTIIYINRLQESTSRILEENVSNLKAAEELEIALLDMKGLTSYYLLDGDENWLKIFDEKRQSYINWLEKARRGARTPEEKRIIREIESLFPVYENYQEQVIGLYKAGFPGQAQNILSGDMRSTFLLIYEKCEEYLAINERLMWEARQHIEMENETASKIMYAIGGIGILLGIFLGIILARSITHPLYELVLKVKGATEKDLIEKVDIADETELDHLDRHVRDLIDRTYEINKDLEQSRKKLMQAEKLAALGQISAGIAHEIYNPLAAIKMLLFSLRNELTLDSQKEKDFEVITGEIARMERFIQNFLLFARPREPVKSPLNVLEVIDNTLALLSPQLMNGKIDIERNFSTPLPAIHADGEQLQQVLVNIILNAIQAMPNGGKMMIRVCINKADQSGSLQISVHDTGRGVPPQILKNIFDPFVTTRSKGSGLGLSIAYQIIKNHGGWIEAVNNPDKGATFRINLPLQGDNGAQNIGN